MARLRNSLEMANETSVLQEVDRFTLAISDLYEVSTAATLIAEHDRDLELAQRISEIGLERALEEAESKSPSTALGDFSLRLVLETGLIVTYARPFTKGYGNDFPLPVDRFVPEEKRKFHAKLLALRNQVYAHIDASAPEGYRRRASWEARPEGGETEEWKGPGLLGQDELRDMADLAEQMIERLRAARREAQASDAS